MSHLLEHVLEHLLERGWNDDVGAAGDGENESSGVRVCSHARLIMKWKLLCWLLIMCWPLVGEESWLMNIFYA